jgi:hypothetical protein
MTNLKSLRLSTRQGYKKGRVVHSPRLLVRCSCGRRSCTERLEIVSELIPTGPIENSSLEINGVLASVSEWRRVLLPLLRVQVP